MEDGDWSDGLRSIGMYLNGHGIAGKDERGGTITDDHFLLYFNAGEQGEITLPPEEYSAAWDVVIDTGGDANGATALAAGSTYGMQARSLIVLQEHREAEPEPDHSVAASLAAQAEHG